jgi:hypothetical protein
MAMKKKVAKNHLLVVLHSLAEKPCKPENSGDVSRKGFAARNAPKSDFGVDSVNQWRYNRKGQVAIKQGGGAKLLVGGPVQMLLREVVQVQ